MTKKIVVSVISDLVTDQRVHRVCQTLSDQGYNVILIGAKKKGSLALAKRPYKTRRIPLLFQRKFPHFAEFNFRLFFHLLFSGADILLGNDLDVMAATCLAGAFLGKPVVYDTHEYYLAMPGLEKKPFVRRVWKRIESFVFSRVNHIYTICDSFCDLYRADYGKELKSVRNVPYLHALEGEDLLAPQGKYGHLLQDGRRLLLFQGAGMNPERGIEELILAMKYLDPRVYHLLLVGGGDIFPLLQEMIRKECLLDRISHIPKVPFDQLRPITRHAHLGLSLDKGENINHRYGLPNKIFDYLHAGVPVLTSRLIEPEKIISQYNVGAFVENHQPKHIAACIEQAFDDPELMQIWKANTQRARQELNWENESKIVLEIFKQVDSEKVNI
jgi:glycosyltransferase involved in cell wall biosynthesis